MNVGGLVGSIGKSASGSPIIFRIILNLSGKVPICGLTLSATGLYFFFVVRCISDVSVSSSVCLVGSATLSEVRIRAGKVVLVRAKIEIFFVLLVIEFSGVVDD